ncbi:MAG: SPOR domain-containing protein [Fibrobacterales bacterium]
MKYTGIILASILVALCFLACGDKEEKKVDIITETLGQPVNDSENGPATDIPEEEFEDIEEAVIPEEPTALADDEYIPKLYESGPYVLQVGVSPSEVIARKLSAKIESKGYTPYISMVENPGDLVGTFYRVRIGYFKSLTQARLFGHNVLMPMNIAFWIDNRKNDEVGNPTKTEEDVGDEEMEDELVEEVTDVTVESDDTEQPVKNEEMSPAADNEVTSEEVPAAFTAPKKEKIQGSKTKKTPGKGDDWASDSDDWANDDWGK